MKCLVSIYSDFRSVLPFLCWIFKATLCPILFLSFSFYGHSGLCCGHSRFWAPWSVRPFRDMTPYLKSYRKTTTDIVKWFKKYQLRELINWLWPDDAICHCKPCLTMLRVIICYQTAPYHYLNQYGLTINVVALIPGWYFLEYSSYVSQPLFEIDTFEIAASPHRLNELSNVCQRHRYNWISSW